MDRKETVKTKSLEEILKKLSSGRFHGNVTIHYSHGQPKKIEYKSVEELNN